MVFTTTKRMATWVKKQLNWHNIWAEDIHGDRTQAQREGALEKFKSGECRVLVATDVAARGLDIPAIHTVLSYEAASDTATRTHRLGRTGRAGRQGVAISLAVASGRKDHTQQLV